MLSSGPSTAEVPIFASKFDLGARLRLSLVHEKMMLFLSYYVVCRPNAWTIHTYIHSAQRSHAVDRVVEWVNFSG